MSRRTSRSPKLFCRPSMRTMGSAAEAAFAAPAEAATFRFFSLMAYSSTFTGWSDVLPMVSAFTLKRLANLPSSHDAIAVMMR